MEKAEKPSVKCQATRMLGTSFIHVNCFNSCVSFWGGRVYLSLDEILVACNVLPCHINLFFYVPLYFDGKIFVVKLVPLSTPPLKPSLRAVVLMSQKRTRINCSVEFIVTKFLAVFLKAARNMPKFIEKIAHCDF